MAAKGDTWDLPVAVVHMVVALDSKAEEDIEAASAAASYHSVGAGYEDSRSVFEKHIDLQVASLVSGYSWKKIGSS